MIGIAVVVQAPESIVSFGATSLWGWGSPLPALIVGTGGLFAKAVVFGAIVIAVGQHYATNKVNIRICYTMTWRRIVSLLVVALVALVLLAIPAVLVSLGNAAAGIAFLVVWATLLLGVYGTGTVQATMLEGYMPLPAVQRSIGLVRGYWRRVLGRLVLLTLVVIGLSFVASLPFAVAGFVLEAEAASGTQRVIALFGSFLVESVAAPVIFITATLVYIDLRVKKEGYTIGELAREVTASVA